MKNRVRLPFYLSKAQFPIEREITRLANGQTKVISARIGKTYEGVTDQLTEKWHQNLVIALNHDNVNIEGKTFTTDVVLDGEYSIEHQDFLNYPLAQANFKVIVTPFNASNQNCMTCDEIEQLDLQDDYSEIVWDGGDTYTYPDLITANDSICCHPYTLTIEDWNTDYFDSVTLNDDNELIVVVKASVPVLYDVWVARYRVTCPNGGYDEANVYGNIQGDSDLCPPPTNLEVTLDIFNQQYASYSFNIPSPAPLLLEWVMYVDGDMYTPYASGTTTSSPVTFTDLEPGEYTFAIRSMCGEGDYSEWVILTGVRARPSTPETCGRFTVTYIPLESEGVQTYSYFDCDGSVVNAAFAGSGIQEVCMLVDGETPIFFAASSEYITINYEGAC